MPLSLQEYQEYWQTDRWEYENVTHESCFFFETGDGEKNEHVTGFLSLQQNGLMSSSEARRDAAHGAFLWKARVHRSRPFIYQEDTQVCMMQPQPYM